MYLIKVEDRPTQANRMVASSVKHIMWFGRNNRFLGSGSPTVEFAKENGIVRRYDAEAATKRIESRLRPLGSLWERTVTAEEFI